MARFLLVVIFSAMLYCADACQFGNCSFRNTACINTTVDCAVRHLRENEIPNFPWTKESELSCNGAECTNKSKQFYIDSSNCSTCCKVEFKDQEPKKIRFWACAFNKSGNPEWKVIKCAYAIFTRTSKTTKKDVEALKNITGIDTEHAEYQELPLNASSTKKHKLKVPKGKAEINFYPPKNPEVHSASVAVIPFNKPKNSDGLITAEVQETKNSQNKIYFFAVNTTILAVSFLDVNGSQVKAPVEFDVDTSNDQTKYSVKPDLEIKEIEVSCMYFNKHKKWDSSVCETITTGSGVTKCKCDHNSAFALVFAAKFIEPIAEGITTLSMVLEIVSVIFFTITIVTLGMYRKKLRNFDRTIVQINLCIALLFMHIFFVVGPSLTKSRTGCVAVSALSHIFLLSSAILMVMEGVLMLIKVLAPHFFGDNAAKNRRIIGFVVAWIPSILFATITAAVADSVGTYLPAYRNIADPPPYQSCWIHYDLSKYVVVIPVAIALLTNICVATRLGIVVWKMSKSAENFKPSNLRDEGSASHAGKAFRAVILLLPILGVPWILGFLVNIEGAENIISSIHVVVNGMQGVMIFVLYIILNQEMRSVIKRTWQSTVSLHSFSPTIHFVSTSTTQTSKRNDSQTDLNTTR